MALRSGIFSPTSNFPDRFCEDYDKLAECVANLKGLRAKIVLTQGSFDMIHIGHARYLEEARSHGDFLIVGVDSDEKIKHRKGPDRPVVPQEERLEMLAHLKSVDIVTLKQHDAPKWSLIKVVKPHVLIATQGTYQPEEIDALSEFCGTVVVLEPQATTSTSAKIRRLHIAGASKLAEALTPRITEAVTVTLNELREES